MANITFVFETTSALDSALLGSLSREFERILTSKLPVGGAECVEMSVREVDTRERQALAARRAATIDIEDPRSRRKNAR